MRGNVFEFARVVVAGIELPEPIVEIGSYLVPGERYPADLRPLLPGKQFIGCDAREGPGVDRVEDVHRLSFDDASVGTVFLLETLEHVRDPLRAMAEVHRVIRGGGIVVASSCMDTPVHEHPADYWRFPPQGFDLLLEKFTPRRVYVQGRPDFPHSLVGIGYRDGGTAAAGALERLEPLIRAISGTSTQEISPLLAPDPFRRLGEELREDEMALYPERMLHVAFDRILRRDEEIARLRAELARVDPTNEILARAAKSGGS
jgi:SAM-dependent methyltransferase